MKVVVYDGEGKKERSIELPQQFSEVFRPDVIMRCFLASQSAARQPYGAYRRAGQRASSKLSRRRRDYKTAYGHGISRVPRKTLWHRGTQFGWVGATSPATVGGRRAHPPKAHTRLLKKVNKKEKKLAFRSALTASVTPELVKRRGHLFHELPSVIDARAEDLKKTKDVEAVLMKLQLRQELERIAVRKVRSGRGKMRGRRYKQKIGPLFVVANECALLKAARNVAGCDTVTVDRLRLYQLAPGGIPGRLTIFSEKAIERIAKENMFTHHAKAVSTKQEQKLVVSTPAKKTMKGAKP